MPEDESRPPAGPAAALSIPDDVRHLDSEQLSRLTEAFDAWRHASPRAGVTVSRRRIWLIYLLLRYTGARLGEVLELDETRDLDLGRRVAIFGGGAEPREVQIPDELADELAEALEDLALDKFRGALFAMDQGHVRRKFYERAREAGLPKEMAGPNVLRRSRAIELLRSGVPLPVVQNMLGHSSANLTAAYVDFSPEDARRITRDFLRQERRKSSARNAFFGKVVRVLHGSIISEVQVRTAGGFDLVSVVTNGSLEHLGLREGVFATAEVKAPWVVLAKGDEAPRVSTRNILPGRVENLRQGRIITEVNVVLADDTVLCALLTDESVKRLGLAPGDPVFAMFKTSAVILGVD